jgi:two-component system, sensor histidine kinase
MTTLEKATWQPLLWVEKNCLLVWRLMNPARVLSSKERLKLERQTLEIISERSPFWIFILFFASIGVLKFGRYDTQVNLKVVVWALVLWSTMILYLPLRLIVQRAPKEISQRKQLYLHFAWAAWGLALSLIWLSAYGLLAVQPPGGSGQFFLGDRTFIYLSILGYVFPVVLFAESRVMIFPMLTGLLLLFYFRIAPALQVIPRPLLAIFYYGPIAVCFVLGWFISVDQARIRARGIQLEGERVRADNERTRANHFIATVSHDLRQPLAALALTLDSLQARAATPDLIADVRSLRQQVNSIEDMVNGSLDLSRLEAGTWRVVIRDVSLQHLIERVISDVRAEALRKGLELEAKTLPYIIRTDPQAFERIIRNLLGNAIRYTPAQSPRGPGRVLLECEEEGGTVRISVADNGIGIPKEKTEKIFEEYVQLGNPERNRNKGLGLGLSIVRGLAQLLSIRLQVESQEGVGSRFSLVLPYVARLPAELRVAGVPDSEPDLTGTVVVLVDDDEVPREALKRRLVEWGCLVIDGHSAENVIAKFYAEDIHEHPHYIISDFRLQDQKNGIEAIEFIRRELGKDIPAAIWSAETSQPKLQAIASAGLEMFSKPPDQKRLIRVLENCRSNNSII